MSGMWDATSSLPYRSFGDAELAEQARDGDDQRQKASNQPDVLAAYTRFVALRYLPALMDNGIKGTSMFELATLLAAWLPTTPLMLVAHLVYVMQFPANMPHYFCEDYWTFLLNLGGLLVLSAAIFPRSTNGVAGRHDLAVEYMLVMRIQYWIIWAGVACWKSNRSFLDWRVSRAPILVIQLIDWLPQRLLDLFGGTESVSTLLVRTAPAVTVAVEGAIPILLAWPGLLRCMGVCLALLLGLGLAVLQEDNAAEFSVWCAIRYFLFLPESSARALSEAWAFPSNLLGRLTAKCHVDPKILPGHSLSSFGFAGVLLLVWPHLASAVFGSLGWVVAQTDLLLFILIAVVLLRAAALEMQSDSCKVAISLQASVWHKLVRFSCWTLTFIYAFVGPILGLQDIGLPHMYSNLELHGGSNHVLFPTGVLQAAAGDSVSAGNPYAGGEILVTRTNSSYLNKMFPAERRIPERHRKLLQQAGHIARQWSPETTEIMGPGEVLGNMLPPAPFTLPALEFRRSLEHARTFKESFFVEYVRKPSQAWGPNLIVDATSMLSAEIHYVEDSLGRGHCQRLETAGPCDLGEPVLLPPPGRSYLERVALKLLLSSSYPVPPAGFPSQGAGCYNR